MTARRKPGPVSKPVKELCIKLCLMNGSEAEFKDGLRKLVHTDASFHAIGTSLQKWALELCKDNTERVWKLADQVDIRIRRAWEKHRDGYSRQHTINFKII